MDVNFIESNPIPVKAAMGLMGLLEAVWRLPLTPPHCDNLKRIGEVLKEVGIAPEKEEC
jgi:4-hydroxy-tetrahydrodipicolinate synthase